MIVELVRDHCAPPWRSFQAVAQRSRARCLVFGGTYDLFETVGLSAASQARIIDSGSPQVRRSSRSCSSVIVSAVTREGATAFCTRGWLQVGHRSHTPRSEHTWRMSLQVAQVGFVMVLL